MDPVRRVSAALHNGVGAKDALLETVALARELCLEPAFESERVIEGELLDFIQASIRSVWHVELLLQLQQSPDYVWTEEELTRVLRASPSIVLEGLAALEAVGLVRADPNKGYRYAPASTELARLAGELERVHREKPFLLMRAILSRPNNKLRTFADAFRLKKD